MGSNSKGKLQNVVGYGKPPVHSQFKPGKSGNPSGKKKPKPTLAALFEKHLDAPVTVTSGGKSQRISSREALVRSFIADGLKGNEKIRRYLLQLMFGMESDQIENNPDIPTTEADLALIESFFKSHALLPAAKPADKKEPKT
jgi:Family of unknown function (DUF5681)